jgi:tRNA threonylcarbamoyladenosine biosynthesis protein TsaE
MPLETLDITSLGRSQTQKIGEALGKILTRGSVVGLVGEMGCGKTVFVKGLAKGLGSRPERVVSPTFTLINEYQGKIPLYHFDLYRLGDPSELDSIDYRRYLADGVCAVEWFERFPDAWPQNAVVVDFIYSSPRKRFISISAEKSLLSELEKSLKPIK